MGRPIPETTIDHPETTRETTATDSSKDEKRKPRPTGDDPVVAVAPGRNDDSLLKKALADAGIKGRKRQEILSLDDPPHGWDVYGWAYYAYAQEWPSNPLGVVIDHLLDPDERHDPPEPFKQFGVEHLGPVIAARALAEAYRNEGYGHKAVVSSLGRDFQEEWREHFGQVMPDELPLPNPAATMWRAESRVLQAGLDRLADSDVCSRWERTWQDF
jgi:hypothetical protein